MWSWTDALPVLRVSPQFTMREMNGKEMAFRSLTGKVRLVTFFYTRCHETCPVTAYSLETLQGILEKQGLFGNKVDFLSVSFDYNYDTPPVLRRFAAEYHPNPHGWFFLSGTKQQTEQAVQGFGVTIQRLSASDAAHEVETFLVDQSGNVRKIYGTAILDPQTVVADIKNVLASDPWAG